MPKEIDTGANGARIYIPRQSQAHFERQVLIRKAKDLMETYPLGLPAIALHYMPDGILQALERDGHFIEGVRIDTAIRYLEMVIGNFEIGHTDEYKDITLDGAKQALYFMREAEKQGAKYAIFMMG